MCGVQPAIEPAKVELAVSAPVGPGRGPLDLVRPLRPNDVFEPARGRKFNTLR